MADRLGLKEQFTCGRTSSEWLEYLYKELKKTETELPDYEIFKKQALFHYQKQPVRPAFAEERRDPQAHPFPTKSGKIEIFSEKVYRTEFKEFVPAIPRVRSAGGGTAGSSDREVSAAADWLAHQAALSQYPRQ